MKYKFVLGAITSPDNLTKVSGEVIGKYISVGYPSDYTEFLAEIGFGDLDDIQIYEEPTLASEIYPELKEGLSEIRLIGDDMQGYCFGYKSDEMIFVEIDSKGVINEMYETSFELFLESYFRG